MTTAAATSKVHLVEELRWEPRVDDRAIAVSAEAGEIRTRMDAAWGRLTPRDREDLQGWTIHHPKSK